MPTLYLIFGHLVADFVLQPNELIKWKFRSWQGIFFHAVIHFLVNLLLFFPYLPDITVFLAILGVSLAHFVIDYVKIRVEKKGRRFSLYFLADQLAHLFVMIAAGLILAGFQPHFAVMGVFSILYENSYILAALTILILCTFFTELLLFQRKRERSPAAVFKPDYGAMLKRAVIFTLIYAVFMIFGVYKVAALG